ncbi:hypothetical protein BK704_34280 [[Bacillus thuringiensis] serovar konkukian]|nr:hypothetical protein [Bacillus thuringiensis]MED1299439.1 hypothetical protein [Bacillus pacificus]OUA92166.1 hypothetical protein BK704_34280 [[Bacillus thuringiensis] serovar konkukian]
MIMMLCSAILLTGMVACSNKGDENPVKSVAQNTSAEKKESSVELSKDDQNTSAENKESSVELSKDDQNTSAENKESSVEETKLSIEDPLSKEDQEIVDALFNSVPELKTYYQKDKEYTFSLTAEVTKPNPNSTDKNEKEHYKVYFKGKVLGLWEFYVQPQSKEVLFKGIFVGNKGVYTVEEFKKETNKLYDYYENVKKEVPEFRKNVKTTVAKKLQSKVAKKQDISDEEIIEYLEEVAKPELDKYKPIYGLDLKKDGKVIKPNPSINAPLKRDFYQVETPRAIFFIKPTFEEKDIYLVYDKATEEPDIGSLIDFSMQMMRSDANNKKSM